MKYSLHLCIVRKGLRISPDVLNIIHTFFDITIITTLLNRMRFASVPHIAINSESF